jgi:hypothetical protein
MKHVAGLVVDRPQLPAGTHYLQAALSFYSILQSTN